MYFEDVSPHIPLAIGVVITACFGWYRGYRWIDMQNGMFNVIHVALPASSPLKKSSWRDSIG